MWIYESNPYLCKAVEENFNQSRSKGHFSRIWSNIWPDLLQTGAKLVTLESDLEKFINKFKFEATIFRDELAYILDHTQLSFARFRTRNGTDGQRNLLLII